VTTAIARRTHFAFENAALALIAAKRSQHTRAAYRRDLRRWLDFCDAEGIDPVATPLDATALFRDHLTASLSNESARRVIAAMSAVYRGLLRGGAVRANPFHPAVLAWPASTAIPKTRMVDDEIAEKMIANALADANARRGARDAAILRLLYDTGLRRSSVAQIVRSKYRPNPGSVETIVKGGKEAELVLPETAIEAVDRWLAVAPESPHLFPGKRGSINVATINKLVKHRATAVGAKHVHPHSFRAAFITAGYDAGLPERDIQASAHHADPSTTRRYDRHARGRTVATKVSEFRKKAAK
jgi:integrase/recombinase XerD